MGKHEFAVKHTELGVVVTGDVSLADLGSLIAGWIESEWVDGYADGSLAARLGATLVVTDRTCARDWHRDLDREEEERKTGSEGASGNGGNVRWWRR
ncbi:MAG: hypothetical protein PHU25_15300 [Deltaproteobacteria bacterium]|nr:hypothetical protein [Deltaproteobacteria bacterium]